MKILVVSAADATNLSIENILKEFLKRGHYIEVFAQIYEDKSVRMFRDMSIPIHPVKELTDKLISQFDIAFCGVDIMNILRFTDIYICAYNFIFNGWASDGADFMFTLCKNRRLRYYEDCAIMPIGVPKNDTPQVGILKKQFLYIDAGHIPFGITGKQQVANMLLEICEKFPDYRLVVKPRWLISDTQYQTHPNSQHIYKVLNSLTSGKLPSNLELLDQHLNLQTLIDESVAVITTSISCYLDVALREKGVIVVGGLTNEDQNELRTNISLKREYENANDAGCLVDFKRVTEYLPQGIMCNESHINNLVAYRTGASSRIVDVVEHIYNNFLRLGKFPKTRTYNYETFKKEMVADQSLNWDMLKYKRMKNSIINSSRIFDSIDVNIDYSDYFRTLEETYQSYPLSNNGYHVLLSEMTAMGKKIWIKEAKSLMSDPINQSLLLQALYDTGQEEEILCIPESKICCNGPYHYYLGKIYEKRKNIANSVHHFLFFLNEANQRSFVKYIQERDNYIRTAYNYLFNAYDGANIPPDEFAEIYIALCEQRDMRIVAYSARKRAHNFIPKVAQQIKDSNPERALKCLQLYAKWEYHYNIRELDNQLKTIQGSMLYRLKDRIDWFVRKLKGGVRCLQEHGWTYTWRHVVERVRRYLTHRKVKPN